MRRERDNQIILVSPEGARDIVRAPAVFEGASFPERFEFQGQIYGYIGTQHATPIYQWCETVDEALLER